jgi:hypothetical protein
MRYIAGEIPSPAPINNSIIFDIAFLSWYIKSESGLMFH